MFEIIEGFFYYGMCLIEVSRCPAFPLGGNINMMVYRKDGQEETWHIDYRFRYYMGTDDPWDDTDRKSFYRSTLNLDGNSIQWAILRFIQALREAKDYSHKMRLSSPDWIMMNGDSKVAMDILLNSKKRWLHIKKMTEEEARKEGRI